MAANTSPIFTLTPRSTGNKLTSTNNYTGFDGVSNAVVLFQAGQFGSRIDELRIVHAGTNLSNLIRFYVNNGAASTSGDNNILWQEVSMSALTTASNSTPQVSYSFLGNNINNGALILSGSARLIAHAVGSVSFGYNVFIQGGDF